MLNLGYDPMPSQIGTFLRQSEVVAEFLGDNLADFRELFVRLEQWTLEFARESHVNNSERREELLAIYRQTFLGFIASHGIKGMGFSITSSEENNPPELIDIYMTYHLGIKIEGFNRTFTGLRHLPLGAKP